MDYVSYKAIQSILDWECYCDDKIKRLEYVTRSTKKVNLPKANDYIHISSRGGIYTVVEVYHNSLKITCKTWFKLFKNGQRQQDFEIIPLSDFRTKAGGIYAKEYEKRKTKQK